jgi:hypothetical protein
MVSVFRAVILEPSTAEDFENACSLSFVVLGWARQE